MRSFGSFRLNILVSVSLFPILYSLSGCTVLSPSTGPSDDVVRCATLAMVCDSMPASDEKDSCWTLAGMCAETAASSSD